MRHVKDKLADVDLRAELLADLASQRCGVRLAFIDLAAGEFPQSGQVHPRLAAGDEKRVIVLDDGGDDDDHGFIVVVGRLPPSRNATADHRSRGGGG